MAISAPSAHNVVQCVKFVLPMTSISAPNYGNNLANFRQWGSSTVSITPKFANSHIRIIQHATMHNVSSHSYLTWKRGGTSGTWIHTDTSAGGNAASDGMFCNHGTDNVDYESSVVVFEDSDPGYTLGNSITYVPYFGLWSSNTVYFGSYQNNGNAQTAQGFHGYLEEIAYT
tara:strand:+ start:26 stop:541 length:516 start_codon:yes stop_codon:yes gene_type:complete